MEATLPGATRWALVTAIAPVAWGSTYFVTRHFLPAGYPLYGAAFRALPAGLLLLAVSRRRPRGSWWWKSLVLGTLNMGAFFALIYVAAHLLPTSLAATIMATSPVVMMLFAWLLLADRPRVRHLAGAGIGIAGVALMLLTGAGTVDVRGVLASAAAMLMSSFGYVLATKWGTEVGVLALTSWQLIAGGVVLAAAAVAVEGGPPSLGGPALAAFGYVAVIATALAFVAWFAGLRRLGAGTVGLVGLLNPVTGVLLGTAVAAEPLGVRQLCGLTLVFTGILLGRPGRKRGAGRESPRGSGISTDVSKYVSTAEPRRTVWQHSEPASRPRPWSTLPAGTGTSGTPSSTPGAAPATRTVRSSPGSPAGTGSTTGGPRRSPSATSRPAACAPPAAAATGCSP